MTKTELQHLQELQTLDLKISLLESDKKNKPIALEEKKEELEENEQRLKLKQQERKDIKILIDRKELDLKDWEGKIAKLNLQLNITKTNKEYSAITTEINSFKANNAVLEDEMLALFSKLEQTEKELAESEKKVEQLKKEYESLGSQVEAELVEIDKQIQEIRQGRQEIINKLPSELVKPYERIMLNKPDRLALACVIDDTCRGCHMDVTPQQVNNLLKWKPVSSAEKAIIFCRSCWLILYLYPSVVPQIIN
ncbi:MAG: hypothetical protein AAB019_00145 [Planctomycetota bacterium]